MEGTETITDAPPPAPSPSPSPAAEDAGENSPAKASADAPSEGGGAAVAPTSAAAGPASMSAAVAGMKKKRGRPRKYSPDGSLAKPTNQTPVSGSVPLGEYPAVKRGRGRAMGVLRHPQHQQQHHSVELESFGEMISCAAGANFTPHVINVAAGEDVTMKIISFSQQSPRAICILSANGVVSNATLRHSDSSGGTLTYEGRFELLSLSGSFMPTENGGTRSCSGGISVSLASQDGRVVGGGVAGLLMAASPVQVVVGSFMPSYQLEQKIKRPKLETGSASTPEVTIPPSITEMETSTSLRPTVAITTCKGENWVSLHPISDTRSSTTDTNVSTALTQDLGSP